MKNILIIAGEASSDMHAANLVNNIKAKDGSISFFGLGGEKMEQAGVKILHNIVHLAFIGPSGLFKHYLVLKKIYNHLCGYIDNNVPDCAILIDYAEFNLRVARHLKNHNVPIIYYISPQVWAWGLWRIKTIEKLIDKMLVLFKFEEALYKRHNVDATFVGHPLTDMVKATENRNDVINKLKLGKDTKIIGILPGSRENEIKKILPIILDSCKSLISKTGNIKLEFILPLAPTVNELSVKEMIAKSGLNIKVIKNYTYNALSICDAAMVASGTATLETALLGVPMAIIYKVNLLTYLMTRAVIKLPYIGLVNVVAGKKIVPEFLQYEARPDKIADYILKLLTDREAADSAREEFTKIRGLLEESGASERAAEEVVNFLKNQ
jgi:lipid-A-disaccharide synthase